MIAFKYATLFMRKNIFNCFTLSTFVLTCGCADLQTRVEKKAKNIEVINSRRNISSEQRISECLALADRFTEKELTLFNLKTYTTETLSLLFESIDNASFYSHGTEKYVLMQESVFNEIVSRKVQTSENVKGMFKRLISARLFNKARLLHVKFPDLQLETIPEIEIIPEIIHPEGIMEKTYKVYDISEDAKTATLTTLPINNGPKIVIAVMLRCNAAINAINYIETDKELLEIFQAYGVILSHRFQPKRIAYWNANTTVAKSYVAYKTDDWPNVSFASSPTFYFFKDGKLMYKHIGWGKSEDKNKENLYKGIKLLGL